MLLLIFLILYLFPALRFYRIYCVTSSPSPSSQDTNFNWEHFIDWPSSPEISSSQQVSQSASQHADMRSTDQIRKVSNSNKEEHILRDPYYLKNTEDAYLLQSWSNKRRLQNQRARKNREEKFEKLSEEEKKAVIERKRREARINTANYRDRLASQGKTHKKPRFLRDLSPDSLVKRRKQNRESARRYRFNHKKGSKKSGSALAP